MKDDEFSTGKISKYEFILKAVIKHLKLLCDVHELMMSVSQYVFQHVEDILKVTKNFLMNRGVMLQYYAANVTRVNFKVDELFFVILACKFQKHICILLCNDGQWCTTPWITFPECFFVFACTEDTHNKLRIFIPCSQAQEMIDTEINELAQAMNIQSEVAEYEKSLPPKIKIGSTSVKRKAKSNLVIQMNFHKSKDKNQVKDTSQGVNNSKKKHLGSFPVKSQRKLSQIRSLESAASVAVTNQDLHPSSVVTSTVSKPLSDMCQSLFLLDGEIRKIYSSKHVNLDTIQSEIVAVKSVVVGLQKYCDDLNEVVTDLQSAVSQQSRKILPRDTTCKARKQYKWNCDTYKVSFRTTT